MLLAYSFSDLAGQYLVAAFVMLYCLVKIISAADDNGEIVKGAKKSFIQRLDRWLK
jgi:hypothetical protein